MQSCSWRWTDASVENWSPEECDRPVLATSVLLSTSNAALLRARAEGSKARNAPTQICVAEVWINCSFHRNFLEILLTESVLFFSEVLLKSGFVAQASLTLPGMAGISPLWPGGKRRALCNWPFLLEIWERRIWEKWILGLLKGNN